MHRVQGEAAIQTRRPTFRDGRRQQVERHNTRPQPHRLEGRTRPSEAGISKCMGRDVQQWWQGDANIIYSTILWNGAFHNVVKN